MARKQFYQTANGSTVIQNNFRMIKALTQKCHHDEVAITCPSCLKAHKRYMAGEPVLKVNDNAVVTPIEDEWKYATQKDLVDADGDRASNKIREFFPNTDLSTTVIDFHSDGTKHVTVFRSDKTGCQLWIRLPRQLDRSNYNYPLWAFALNEALKAIDAAFERNSKWKRKLIVELKYAESATSV
ncbi:hypothetical protein [Streptomyces sp. CoH17]|uniref:hypothetical protein n=1 Tax=Streptomyces sp. CoH17 TaxID=2992806 RepID=UPI00226F9645|nr:hypothetical protein [Streptomyces sp. CoH17]